MSDYNELWRQLDTDATTAGTVVRRVLPELPHDVRLGQQANGERFVDFCFHGPIGLVPSGRPRTRGLEVVVKLETANRARLQMRETTGGSSSQFEEIVRDVLELLERRPDQGAAARVLERLIAWERFFSRLSGGLSSEAAAGLFAELTILKEIVIPIAGAVVAVSNWTGPDPALQDFQCPQGSIEVKAYSGPGPGTVQISSERQLDPSGAGNLILSYVELDVRAEGIGCSLAEAVDGARTLVSESPSAAARLEDQLLRAGWANSLADSQQQFYTVRKIDFFEVREDFPKITSELLPSGISKVRYQIAVNSLSPFIIDKSRLGELLGFK